MPITRLHQGSAPPSEGKPEPVTLRPEEIEILYKRLIEKEKMLQEQAEALRQR